MANTIGLMGESGSGKTTSLETLDPKTTFILNCDKKRLPFRKEIRDQYRDSNLNYFVTDNQATVLSVLKKIDTQDNMKHIKVVVVDTINGIMVADESRRRKEKNYDKWADLAWAVYDIIDYALTARDDLTVIFIAHEIGIETKLTTVLYSKAVPNGDTVKYVFETRAMNSTAKTPRGVFADLEVPNDMAAVLQRLEEY